MRTLSKSEWSNPFGRVVYIICPKCKEKARLDHEVDSFGNVSPSVVCPFEPCDFHEYVRLEGWDNPKIEKSGHPPDVIAKIPKIRARLTASVSGFIRVVKFSIPDRTVLNVMIERGEVEIFQSTLGKAYRFTTGDDDGKTEGS